MDFEWDFQMKFKFKFKFCDEVPDLLDPNPPARPARTRLWLRVRDPIDEEERLDQVPRCNVMYCNIM
jgi:hypothetical protein